MLKKLLIFFLLIFLVLSVFSPDRLFFVLVFVFFLIVEREVKYTRTQKIVGAISAFLGALMLIHPHPGINTLGILLFSIPLAFSIVGVEIERRMKEKWEKIKL